MNRTALPRRRLLGGLAALATWPLIANAQETRPIEWVVGFAPGGGSDVVARTVAEAMAKELKQTIIINNKPGAATNIAAEYVAKSKDIGHVMLTADFATLATNPFLYSKLGYSADRDLALVGMLVRFPLILVVGPNVPAKDFKEFLAWAKAQKDGVSYASPGAGTPHHLATELLRQRAGLTLTHVPYRGAAPAIQDVIGGSVPFMFVESAGGMPHITSGRLRPLAVASASRMSALPEVPTLAQQGVKDAEAYAWQGVAVPAATAPATVERLNQALVAALNSAPVKARFQTLGTEPLPGSAADMAQFAQVERERWGRLIRQLDLKLD